MSLGGASDIALERCIEANAGFVICPCCIGKIKASRSLPLSHAFRSVLSDKEFRFLVRAGDFGHTEEVSSTSSAYEQGRRISKCYIEEDRRQFAVDHGYNACLTVMVPHGGSPKSDILYGWPRAKERGKEEDCKAFYCIPTKQVI